MKPFSFAQNGVASARSARAARFLGIGLNRFSNWAKKGHWATIFKELQLSSMRSALSSMALSFGHTKMRRTEKGSLLTSYSSTLAARP